MNDLEKLFISELKDIYDAEQQLVEALEDMEKNAVSEDLKTAFRVHREQTTIHVNRLEEIFREFGEKPKRKTCDGIEGIIDEGQKMAKEYNGNAALDAALIAAGQKAEHYEIASYGSLCSWAAELGRERVVTLLEQTLEEEREADATLTELAESAVNSEARQQDTGKKSETAASISKIISHGT